ncbi:site-specific DNA-methyltransferase [Oxalobacter sp. OxGP1]|uniref:DNA methyltransferase n=1 Tax=Oxalobacter paeniformigenes TaxID=2946594 RepID=UPI0022AF6264|nr:DNA methyltransferase [Oxalobacter paeniformigenes]MCZ4052685.1 site-specific DNA-methyltransferase [Oxalobacter paeniformigenes]
MEQLSFIKPTIKPFIVDSFSANGFAPDNERKKLEKKFSECLVVTEKFNRQSVSYQLSKKDVLHSWLKYKEGFSANLVNVLLDEMGACPGDWVMDPFMGSGTTALVCQMRGINSIGYDIMPISALSIKAKAAVLKYDLNEINNMIRNISEMTVPLDYKKKTPYIDITRDAYPCKNERFLAYIYDWIEHSKYTKEAKNLLTLCIVNSLERCSYTIKSGQYLGWDSRSKKIREANEIRKISGKKLFPKKYVREEILDSKLTILDELAHVFEDIKVIQKNGMDKVQAEIDFVPSNVLYELPLLDDCKIKGVITSPPYCNRYDYTRIYALELVYLGLKEQDVKKMRQCLLSCTVENKSKLDELRDYYFSIGQINRFDYIYSIIKENEVFSEIMTALFMRKESGDLNNNGVIRMVEGYFTELAFIYAELYRVCKSGAMVAFVNDNVRYAGEVIPVDFLSSLFAEQFGFKIKTIYTLKQQKGNSSQQMAKYGRVPLRKSVTVWVKE